MASADRDLVIHYELHFSGGDPGKSVVTLQPSSLIDQLRSEILSRHPNKLHNLDIDDLDVYPPGSIDVDWSDRTRACGVDDDLRNVLAGRDLSDRSQLSFVVIARPPAATVLTTDRVTVDAFNKLAAEVKRRAKRVRTHGRQSHATPAFRHSAARLAYMDSPSLCLHVWLC